MTVDLRPLCPQCGHMDDAHDSLGCLHDCSCRQSGAWVNEEGA